MEDTAVSAVTALFLVLLIARKSQRPVKFIFPRHHAGRDLLYEYIHSAFCLCLHQITTSSNDTKNVVGCYVLLSLTVRHHSVFLLTSGHSSTFHAEAKIFQTNHAFIRLN